MNSKLIIIAGQLAAGKTTFAKRLFQELKIPYFSKDMFKLAMSRSLTVNGREDSKRLSAGTFDAIEFVAERLMETHSPFIIEANFVMGENHGGVKEGEALTALIERYNYKTLTYVFTGNPEVLLERFNQREKAPELGEANKMPEELTLEVYEYAANILSSFNIGGEIVKVDTTDFEAVDFNHHVETARIFMGLDEVDYTMY